MKELKQKDIAKLNEAYGVVLLCDRTEAAINQTYGKKQATKARRKLPGNRKWKDKEKQYATLRT